MGLAERKHHPRHMCGTLCFAWCPLISQKITGERKLALCVACWLSYRPLICKETALFHRHPAASHH